MSQPPSRSESAASIPIPRQDSLLSSLRSLRQFLAEDLRPTFLEWLLASFADPFERREDGKFKVNPLWVSLAVFAALGLSVFLYFNLRRA